MTNRIGGWRALTLAFPVLLLVSCAGTSDVDVTNTARLKVDAHVGKGLNTDRTKIENISDTFTPTETVFAVVDMPTKIDGSIKIRWTLATGETLSEETMTLQEGATSYPYQLAPPAEGHKLGEYRFEVYVNDNRTDSETFKIQTP